MGSPASGFAEDDRRIGLAGFKGATGISKNNGTEET